VLAVGLGVLTVVVAPDQATPTSRAGRLAVRSLAASFRFPSGAGGFSWALWGRLEVALGYFMINGYPRRSIHRLGGMRDMVGDSVRSAVG
jgi:hypothetical protein